MLIYNSHEVNGVLVFTVEDPAGDDERLSTQREWLYGTIESRADSRYVIDLGAIHYMASADLGFLITVKRRIESHKGKVVLCRIDPFIHDIFRTMRLDKLFVITENLDQALAHLQGTNA